MSAKHHLVMSPTYKHASLADKMTTPHLPHSKPVQAVNNIMGLE